MTRPRSIRLHLAGPWLCSTVILLYVALSPVIFVATGEQWLWPWILTGVPVVALTLWLSTMAYDLLPDDSAAGAAESAVPSTESGVPSTESGVLSTESGVMAKETVVSSPTSEDSTYATAVSADASADSIGTTAVSADASADSIGTTADSADASAVSADASADSAYATADSARRGGEAGMRVAVLSLSRKVQASAHRIQEESTRLVARFPAEPEVLEAGMRVDHAAAQQARLAQSVATLCGEQPGQHWRDPLPVADAVRGAAGRITAYRRIRIEGDPPVAVQGAYVEPLIHLLAELLANATQSSPPATDVLVTIRSVRGGAALEIDDAGVGMDETNLARMREVASGTRPVRLDELGEIPQTGLAVVGTYVRRHGFRVDLTESVHGGLRAAVLIPEAMTTPLAAGDRERTSSDRDLASPRTPVSTLLPASRPTRTPQAPREPERPPAATPWPVHRAPAAPEPVPDDEPEALTSDGLPQRRSKRGQRPPTGQQPAVNPIIAPRSEPTAEQAGAWMRSFLSSQATQDSTTAAPEAAPEKQWRNDER